jgi:Spy/CpxP family protein refolding chaperone
MNRWFQTFLVGTAVLGLSIVSLVSSPTTPDANAQGGGQGKFGRKHGMHGRFSLEAPLISLALRHQSELNLSPEQVGNLEKIRTNYQNQFTPIRQQLRGIEDEIHGLLQESPANLIQVRLKIEEAEKIRSELRYLRIEALENGKSILTAEQRDQLRNLIASSHRGFRKPQGQAS